MNDIKERLRTVERPRRLWMISQLIHELTIPARLYYGQADAAGRMQEISEAIHYVSGHSRDLANPDQPFTPSRADSVGEAMKLLTPAALDRLHEFAA